MQPGCPRREPTASALTVGGRLTRVGERAAGDRNELPAVAMELESHAQDAEGATVVGLGGGSGHEDRSMASPARTGYELADPIRIDLAVRRLLSEPLVVVVVAVQHDVSVEGVKVVPPRLVGHHAAVPARAELRVVPHRE